MKKHIAFYILILIILIFCLLKPKEVRPTNSHFSKIIYIDPGHGGADGGTVAPNGIFEKDIVLIVSYYLKSLFEGNGFMVYMTRHGDYDLASKESNNRKRQDIRQRVKLINDSEANLYVSIHANSYPSQIVYGAQTFYSKDNAKSKTLAICIQDSIKKNLKNTNREALSISDKFLLDNVNKTGCLIEVGFFSNPRELALLLSEEYQLRMATAIYSGVLDFFAKQEIM